jgi:hypothetical protein
MGNKNERNRQKRLQRKRHKRAANRAARRERGDLSGWSPSDSPMQIATASCIAFCGGLLAGCGRLDGEMRQAAVVASKHVGGILGQLPFELESFLHNGAQWSLTCTDLESTRSAFEEHDADDVFGRLWTLALTNEPDPAAFATAQDQDCPHRAALAFQDLRAFLDDPGAKPVKALRAIAEEIEKHSPARTALSGSYQKLLLTAIASVHASPAQHENVLGELARHCRKVFDLYSRDQSSTAWWQCGRLFLAEVLERHQGSGGTAKAAAYADLHTLLLDAPEAAVRMTQNAGSTASLRSVHIQATADAWRRFLEQQIDTRTLAFEDRVRYEIARLKILRTEARRKTLATTDGEPLQILAAFEALQGFLAHGVPPASRALPSFLDSPLIDFYADTVRELHCEDVALRTTEGLLRRHPDDFRLGCLYATGAVMRGDHAKLALLAQQIPRRHIDVDLFAHCAMIWARLPRGTKGAAAIRPNLFDPLDREHRKQCLMKLAQQCLRRATTLVEYAEELHSLLPYFERDNFVYRDLREKAAVESSLVFLATMMAPLHDLKLSLTENQSQQWVSHAREIAQQSPLGSRLAIHYLKSPSRGSALTPAVRRAACARIGEFQPPSARHQVQPVRPERAQRKRRTRKPTQEGPATQPGLFDAIDP